MKRSCIVWQGCLSALVLWQPVVAERIEEDFGPPPSPRSVSIETEKATLISCYLDFRSYAQGVQKEITPYIADYPLVFQAYNDFIIRLDAGASPELQAKILRAIQYAAEKHKGIPLQGKADLPYLYHVLKANALLWDSGVRDPEILTATILQDVLENEEIKESYFTQLFGHEILALVRELMMNRVLTEEQRRQRLLHKAVDQTAEAKLIELASVIVTLRSLHATPPQSWTQEEIDAYRRWAAEVAPMLKGYNPYLSQAYDMAASLTP